MRNEPKLDCILNDVAARALQATGATSVVIGLGREDAMICCATAGLPFPNLEVRINTELGLTAVDIWRRMATAVRPNSVLILTSRFGNGSPAVAQQIIASSRPRPITTLVAPVACSALAATSLRIQSSLGSFRIASLSHQKR